MEAIEKHTGYYLSGIKIKGLFYQHAANVESISYPEQNHQVDVTLKSGHEWKGIYFAQDSGEMSVSQKKSDAGYFYVPAIRFAIPKLRGDVLSVLHGLRNREIVLLVIEMDGTIHLIGTIDQPARLTFSESLPWVSRSGFDVTAETETDQPPYIVSQQITAGGDFSDDFSNDFSTEV